MKAVLPLLLLSALLGGCSSSEEGAVPTAAPLNPGGKPRNEQEAAEQKGHQEAGQRASAAMSEAARAEAEARAKSGGK